MLFCGALSSLRAPIASGRGNLISRQGHRDCFVATLLAMTNRGDCPPCSEHEPGVSLMAMMKSKMPGQSTIELDSDQALV